jgi:hypothetical protein
MLQLISLDGLIKPLIHLLYICLIGSISIYAAFSLSKRFDLPLALLLAGSILGMAITAIWLILGLQTEWKLTLLPKEIRQALYLFIQLCYPIEIIIASSAFYCLARRNSSLPPSLPKNNES